MKITIFGLAITSSWGNGHATTYRALCGALAALGHRITFFERDAEWYASNRDMPRSDFCDVRLYDDWQTVLPQARRELNQSDVAIVGSYFPDGAAAMDEVLSSRAAVKAFYDIDTPITVSQLRESGDANYLRADQIQHLDLYFSFTGGPLLREIEQRFGVRRAVPLYCSVDPERHHAFPADARFACDLSYMGTYAPDRQPKLNALLCTTAQRLPRGRFIVAGPQYPEDMRWPANVERIVHLEPRFHPFLYSSSRLTLNVTRRDMVMAGYSPSVRLFEAAACGAPIVSDDWPGLDSFFVPGREILLAQSAEDVFAYLSHYSPAELRSIGVSARQRVLEQHSSHRRAREFEAHVESAMTTAARSATAAIHGTTALHG